MDSLPLSSRRYLDLLKRCLTRELFADEVVVDVLAWPTGGPLGDPEEIWQVLHKSDLRIVRPFEEASSVAEGKSWPPTAETMVGQARLDNVAELCIEAIANNVPGDFVECGVWRGGVIALMRAVLDATADANRRVWACDSFQGLPEPDVENYPADAASSIEGLLDGFISHQIAVSLDQVRSNIDRYQLLDDRIEFLEGWFKDTLPTAPIDQIALLRLDGDLYESTMDALTALEPKVSDGGYIIVDDYLSWDPCRQAVEDYREAHGIVAAIHQIDWTGVWWQKGASA